MTATDQSVSAGQQSCCSIIGPRIRQEEAEEAAGLLKALADPARVRIVNLLATAGRPLCICELTPTIGLAQATVSFHMKKLLAAGLVDRDKRGIWGYYSLRADALSRIAGIFEPQGGTT